MNDREQSIQWHLNYCVHYQRKPGMTKREACAAGMIYEDISKVSELGRVGCALRLPCLRSHHTESERRGQPLCECLKLEWKTREQAEAEHDATELAVAKTIATFPLVEALREKHKGQDWRGVEECPVCKGKLHLIHSGFNGHTRGKCETEGCVAWIE